MDRHEALEELRSRLLVAVQGGDWVKTKWDIGELWMELGSLTSPLRAALSSPCAICGGKEPLAGWRGWQHNDWKEALGSPRHPGKDCCHQVQVLIFALPTKEGVPAFRQGFTDGSSLLLEEPDFPGVPGAWEEKP